MEEFELNIGIVRQTQIYWNDISLNYSCMQGNSYDERLM